MKKLMIIAALVLSVSTSVFAAKPSNVKVVSKAMDVVYIKVSCDMIGAEIEVHDATGTVIHTANITDKKVLIDFYAEPSGEYTIVVKKNGNEESISYNKFSGSRSELASHNFVTVTQN